jgi:nitronate monooxygenase
MRRLDDFRLQLGRQELVPIVIGGMGVDISSSDLALEAARLGGVGHISDAMVKTVTDRRYKTKFVKAKQAMYKANVDSPDKSLVKFDLGHLAEATRLHVEGTMSRKQGSGMVLINCMEKLTMNAPKETLKVRMSAALDAGIDGITLAAGLHLGSLALIEDHPRFAMPSWASSCRHCAHCSSSSRRTAGSIACPTMSWSKARWPAAIWASGWTGPSTTWPPSWPKSCIT